MGPLYLIDGYNVLHAVVLEGRERQLWWSAAAQARVIDLVSRFEGGEVQVVFDARGGERAAGTARVPVRFAASADEEIVRTCAALAGTRPVVVVSADRALCDRSRRHGAERLSPWRFRERCNADGVAPRLDHD